MSEEVHVVGIIHPTPGKENRVRTSPASFLQPIANNYPAQRKDPRTRDYSPGKRTRRRTFPIPVPNPYTD